MYNAGTYITEVFACDIIKGYNAPFLQTCPGIINTEPKFE